MLSFLVIFVMFIFEIKKYYFKEYIVFLIILLLFVGDFIYSLFDIVGVLKLVSSLVVFMMMVIFGVFILLWCKGNLLVKYFLFGYFMFVIFNMLVVFYYKGISEVNVINSYGVGIGILFEVLMMVFIFLYWIKIFEKVKV